MDAKAVKHGLRVELIGADDYDRGVWHVLERSPRGSHSAWYVHRWQDVAGERVWRSLTVEPKQMMHAHREYRESMGDPMAYPALVEAAL